MTAPTDVVSLFAGIGGIDLAARHAGLTTRLMCEIDAPCRKVLAHRFPDAVIHDDVRTLTADDLHRAGAVPDRTVLTAGFPCQDLSVAGRRRGLGEGTRSGLFWQVDRLLAEFAPAWVLLENVPGLLSATCACPGDRRCGDPDCPGETHQVKGGACDGQCIRAHGGVMGAVLGSLAERGYGFAYRVLDARYFGVPQRRRRVFIVGHLGGTGAAPAEILFEPEGVSRDSAAGSEAGSGVAGTARERVAGGGRPVAFHLTQDPISGPVSPAMTAGNAQGCATISVALGGAWVGDLAPTLEAGDNRTGGTRPPGTTVDTVETLVVGVLGQQSHALTAEGSDASEDGTGRGTPVIAFDHLAGGDRTSSGYASTEATQTILAGGGALRGAALDTQQGGADDNAAQGGHLDAYPMAVRGRQDGAELEIGKPGDPMFALRAGNGGSSRSQLIATALTTKSGATFDDQQIGQLVVGDPLSVSENQRGELNLTDTAALSTGGGKPGLGYPAVTDGVTVRRLTPMECERLQGAPDQWTDVDDASDSQRYREMGNSVAVPVVEWTLSRLVRVAESLGGAA